MRLLPAAALVLTLTTAQSLRALSPQQSSPEPADSGLKIHATSRLVLIDVVVSDQNGSPVRGLTRENFQLFENNREQEIKHCEEFSASSAPASTPVPAQLPPNVYTNFEPVPKQAAVTAILFDFLNTPWEDQVYARKQMLAYLKALPPGTQVAIFALAGKLHMLQAFSSDPEALIKALTQDAANPRTSSLLGGASPGLSDPGAASLPGVQAALSSLHQFQTDSTAGRSLNRAQLTIDAFRQIGAYLARIPGRKNLLWLSGSFPTNPGTVLSIGSQIENVTNFAQQVNDVGRELTIGDTAVYPIDVRGVMVSSMMSPGFDNDRDPGSYGGAEMLATEGTFSANTASERNTMDQLANETGGRAFYNTNNIVKAIGTAIQSGSHYYQLAYSPSDEQWNGDLRKIRVRVDNPRWQLAYRRSYNAGKREKAKGGENVSYPYNPMQSAMRRGNPSSTELIFQARVLPIDELPPDAPSQAGATPRRRLPMPPSAQEVIDRQQSKHPTRRYVVDFLVSGKELALTSNQAGVHHGAVDAVAVAYDAAGHTLNDLVTRYQLDLQPATYASFLRDGLPIRLKIDLPVGAVYLRLGIHDGTSNKIGSLEIPLQVKLPTRRSDESSQAKLNN